MKRGGSQVLIELDGAHATIVQLTRGGGGVQVRRALVACRPSDVDPGDARGVSQWIGRVMSEAGVPRRGRATVALSRNEAMVKRFDVRVPENADGSDVDGAVRMQMSRQLAASMERGQVDYRVLADEPAEEGARRIVAVAGALPNQRLEHVREVVRASGLKLGRITLRAFGAASVVSRDPALADEAVIAVAPGANSSEVVLIEDGAFQAARGIDVAWPGDEGEEATTEAGRRLAVEVKRTWASYRAGPDSREVKAVVVLGDDERAEALARSAGETLGVAARAIGPSDELSMHEAVEPLERAASIALAGLVLEGAAGVALDFEHPTAPPPKSQQRRQVAMLAVLVLILLGGGGYLAAERGLDRLRDRVDEAEQRRSALGQRYLGFLTERARGQHMRAWLSGNPDWLDQMAWIVDRVPDPPRVLLEQVDGAEEGGGGGVVFSSGENGDALFGGSWTRRRRIVWGITGRARDADTLGAMRKSLLEGNLVGVRTRGPDAGSRFDLTLSTTRARLSEAREASSGGGTKAAGADSAADEGGGS